MPACVPACIHGVLLLCCSGLFIIAPDGTLRQKTVNDLPVGRRYVSPLGNAGSSIPGNALAHARARSPVVHRTPSNAIGDMWACGVKHVAVGKGVWGQVCAEARVSELPFAPSRHVGHTAMSRQQHTSQPETTENFNCSNSEAMSVSIAGRSPT